MERAVQLSAFSSHYVIALNETHAEGHEVREGRSQWSYARSETTQQRVHTGANPMYSNSYDTSEIGKHVNRIRHSSESHYTDLTKKE